MKRLARFITAAVALCLVLFLSVSPSASAEEVMADGTDGNISWTVSTSGQLSLTGSGAMEDYLPTGNAPWLEYKAYITSVNVGDGITSVGNYAFLNCLVLETANLPGSLEIIGIQSFANCVKLTSIVIPENVAEVKTYAFTGCTALRSVEFLGNAPTIGDKAFKSVTAAVYPSCLKTGWDATNMLQYSGQLTWSLHAWSDPEITKKATCLETGVKTWTCSVCLGHKEEAIPIGDHSPVTDEAVDPTWNTTGLTEGSHCSVCSKVFTAQKEIPATGCVITIPGTKSGDTVEIDGVSFTVNKDGKLSGLGTGSSFAVVFKYNTEDISDIHKVYPVEMSVYELDYKGVGNYEVKSLEGFDGIFQYSGSSIRIAGKKGIRMISSVPTEAKKALTGKGLEGYTLIEYGTLVGWDSSLAGKDLTFSADGVMHASAYVKDKADPVFSKTETLTQFTNVLVGFTAEQCVPDLAMRPYMILEDSEGNTVYLYGGTVHRSIGYIAWQNRNTFKPGTAEYEYIWELIRNAYGDKYDSEYSG